MCRVMEQKFQEGVEQGMQLGMQQGEQQGTQKTTLKVVLNMINMLHMTPEQAFDVAGVPKNEFEKYEELIKNANS